MPDLADVLASLGESKPVTRIGKVTSVAPFKVTFFGATDGVALPRLSSYAPVLNDAVLVVGDMSVVLGKVTPADLSQAINVPTRSY